MKKWLAALLSAALCIGVFGTAEAAKVRQQIRWITHSTACPGLVCDSAYVSEGSGQNADTSAAIPLWSFVRPSKISVAAVDTSEWFRVEFVPSTGTGATAASDSIYLGTQVSRDGANWVNVTPTQTYIATGKDGTLNGIVLQEQGTTNTFAHTYQYVWTALGQEGNTASENATTAPTGLQLSDFSFVRFIVQGDFSGAFSGLVVANIEPK